MDASRDTAGRPSFVPRLSYGDSTRVGRSNPNGSSGSDAATNPLSSLSSIHAATASGPGTGLDRARSDSYKYGHWLASNNNTTMSNSGGADRSATLLHSSGTDAHHGRDGGSSDGVGERSARGLTSDVQSPAPRWHDRTAVGAGSGAWRSAHVPVHSASGNESNLNRTQDRSPPRHRNADRWENCRGDAGDVEPRDWRQRAAAALADDDRPNRSRWDQQGRSDEDDAMANRHMTIPRWRAMSGSPSAHPSAGRPNVFSGGTDVRGTRWSTTHVGANRTRASHPPDERNSAAADWLQREEGGRWQPEGMVNTPGRRTAARADPEGGGLRRPMFRYGKRDEDMVSTLSKTTTASDGLRFTESSSSSSADRSESDGSSTSSDASSSRQSSDVEADRAAAKKKTRYHETDAPSRPFTDLRNFRPDGAQGSFPFMHANGLVVDEADRATIASMMTNDIDLDATPVVPDELVHRAQQPVFLWNRHPSHTVVLMLLQHRGIYLPRYRELIDYHMAELFLHYLDACSEGSYFVYYAADKWPKERFFRIRMLPLHRMATRSEPIPQLVITMHQAGVAIVDAIPLDFLVGVTTTPRAPCFRPLLESPNTILGCREGRGHRARLPVDGCFSLWFYDRDTRAARSVDLLTCDAKIYDIWTKAFMGIVSVNSSSVVQVGIDPGGAAKGRGSGEGMGPPTENGSANEARMAELTRAAQEQTEADMAARQERKKGKGCG